MADFKSYMKGYLCNGANWLIALGQMHLLKFYVNSSSWPIMMYKKSAVDGQWYPHNKSVVRLRNADTNDQPILLQGNPKPVPFKYVSGNEVSKFLPEIKRRQERQQRKPAK